MLEAAKRHQALDFIWVGSDAWVSRESVVYGREEVVHGAIALQPLRYRVKLPDSLIINCSYRRQLPGFNDYFNQLSDKYLNESRNPWYEEYYKTYCNCSNEAEDARLSLCPFSSRKRPKIHQVQQPYIHFVRYKL